MHHATQLSQYPGHVLNLGEAKETMEAFGLESSGRHIQPHTIASLWPSSDAQLDQDEFVLQFLVSLGRVDRNDIADAGELFDTLRSNATKYDKPLDQRLSRNESIFAAAGELFDTYRSNATKDDKPLDQHLSRNEAISAAASIRDRG